MAKKANPHDATLRNVRAAQKRLNTLDKQLTKRLNAMDWAIEELLPRFEAVLERLTLLEGRVDHLASTQVFTDAMPVGRKR